MFLLVFKAGFCAKKAGAFLVCFEVFVSDGGHLSTFRVSARSLFFFWFCMEFADCKQCVLNTFH